MSDYLQKRRDHIAAGRPLPPTKKYTIKKKSDKRAAKEAAQKEVSGGLETDLQKWYLKIMKTETPICWETGNKIDKRNDLAWRGSIAHVLQKSLFPSVATHPQNYLILEMFGGSHGQYDSSWTNAQKMKVWKIALERFIMIEPDIATNERKYIPNCFLVELEKRDSFTP